MFFKAEDPEKLAAWYQSLGMRMGGEGFEPPTYWV